MNPVMVEWIDSVGGGGWERPEEARRAAERETMRVTTLGYVLGDTDDYLLLCMSVMENNESVLAPLQIPKVAVLSVRDVSWKAK